MYFVFVSAKVDFNLNEHATGAAVKGGVNAIVYNRGWTDTASGLSTAASLFTVSKGDRASATNVIVLLTDGMANRFEGSSTNNGIYEQRAEELKAIGILFRFIPRT